MNSRSERLVQWLGLSLGLATLACFWSVTRNGFVTVDDPQYLLENSWVRSGLSWPGIGWALASRFACNWHPVTWWSHMLDCTLFGLNPAGHHLVNACLHAANACLLLLWLRGLTGAVWRSLCVAALFASHPLRVESVAWASERKDVLSLFFGLLSLMAYVRYARGTTGLPEAASGGRSWFYFCALGCFVLALMSKPMLVTLPGVMLLLDHWPLQRERDGWRKLVGEKLPFMALSLGVCAVTISAQLRGGAVASASAVPLGLRVENALVSYVKYIGNHVAPLRLSAIYPYPAAEPWWAVAGSVIILGLLSWLALARISEQPALFTGWFWFLGTLIPAIGLVQVGPQAMADRYTYLPSIGLLMATVWGIAALANSRPWAMRTAGVAAVAAVVACVALTQRQIGYWKDGPTLYAQATLAAPGNHVAQDYLGMAWYDRGEMGQAIAALRGSVRLKPGYSGGQYDLGAVLLASGKPGEAREHLEAAVRLAPGDGDARLSLANCLLQLGRWPEAESAFAAAAVLKPQEATLQSAWGTALLLSGRAPAAEQRFRAAVQLKPNWAGAHRNLAVALAQQGRLAEAVAAFAEAVRLDPNDAELRFNLGMALLENGEPARAWAELSESLRLRPNDARTHYRCGLALAALGREQEAVIHYREALRLDPDSAAVRADLAWVLATSANPVVRNSEEALRVAEMACAAEGPAVAGRLVSLAAAYAGAGRLAEAATTARRAEELARGDGQTQAAARAAKVLKQCAEGNSVDQ